MFTDIIDTQSQANNAGFPPAPPKAPQKADGRRAEIKAFRQTITATYGLVQEDDDLGISIFQNKLTDGRVAVKAFSGNRKKADFHYIFSTLERAEQYVSEWYAGRKNAAQRKAEQAAARRAEMTKPQTVLQVGDVLIASWGYDQTNIDYYQVIRLVGKRSVEIREIAQERQETAWLQGECVPVKDNFTGEPMVRRVNLNSNVKINHWGVWAHKEPSRIVGGLEVFTPRHWTAYA